MTDLSKVSFDSQQNYLKRSEFVGSQALTLGSAGAVTTHTVEHNLGYIPFYIVASNLNDTSIIWSNNRVHEHTQTSLSGVDVPVQIAHWTTTTTLTIRITNGTGALAQSGSRTVYWGVYLDYEES